MRQDSLQGERQEEVSPKRGVRRSWDVRSRELALRRTPPDTPGNESPRGRRPRWTGNLCRGPSLPMTAARGHMRRTAATAGFVARTPSGRPRERPASPPGMPFPAGCPSSRRACVPSRATTLSRRGGAEFLPGAGANGGWLPLCARRELAGVKRGGAWPRRAGWRRCDRPRQTMRSNDRRRPAHSHGHRASVRPPLPISRLPGGGFTWTRTNRRKPNRCRPAS